MAEARTLDRLVVLSPFGVNPPRSGGHLAVLEPAKALARAGVGVHLFGLGIRRFEAFRHFRSFVRPVEANLVEERHVSLFNWLDYLRRGRSGLPGLRAAGFLERKASEVLRRRCAGADVVQYECPWLFGFRVGNRPRVLVAHNAEVDLLRGTTGADEASIARAAEIEGEAWRDADGVICLTEEDRRTLADAYGEREAEVIPLGVDTDRHRPPTAEERDVARKHLGVEGRYVVLFTGAWHLPNRTALSHIVEMAPRTGENVLFVAAGSVNDRREQGAGVLLTGPLPDLGPWFAAADCCVNPMTTGSGANVKILDYLARGLPVVTTPFGARGIDLKDGCHALIREVDLFPAAVERLRCEPDLAAAIAAEGRALVERERSWTVIAGRRRLHLSRICGEHRRRDPASETITGSGPR